MLKNTKLLYKNLILDWVSVIDTCQRFLSGWLVKVLSDQNTK